MPLRNSNVLKSSLKYLLSLVALAAIFILGYFYWFSVTNLHPQADIYVVEQGTGLRAFSRQLYKQHVLPDSHSLVWLAYLKGQSRELKAGEYRFRDGITALELLEQVMAGRVVEYPFTIIEGWTFRQIMQAFAQAPKLAHGLQNLNPEQVMASLGYPGLHPEGRFYPDTYYYSAGMSDLLILQRAFNKMEARLKQEWAMRDTTIPIKSPEEALILASIVERESAVAEERAVIAGVFINRLRIGMRLQTDPTVIYGMGERYRGNITRNDLRQPSPYNTYVIKGLPPTPIAMPSGAALHAALNPQATKALYFVARGDGSHVFSENLVEHNRAVEEFQLKSRKPTQALQGSQR